MYNNYNWNNLSNWNNKFKQQKQSLKQESAYEKKVAYNMFYSVIKWLEKYVEIAHGDLYPDWQKKKRFRDDGIKRPDINSPERAEDRLSNSLYMLADDYPLEFREEWKKEFYKWIDATKISADNCPEKLKHYLFGVNEILEGRGEKVIEDAENKKNTLDVNSSEYAEALNKSFASMQVPLQNQREEEKSLEGKTSNDLKIESKFNRGNTNQGKKVFEQIKREIANHHDNFHFWPQKEQIEEIDIVGGSERDIDWITNSYSPRGTNYNRRTLIENIKKNINEWEFKEIITFSGCYWNGKNWVKYSNETKEWMFVDKSAQIKHNAEGVLIIQPEKMYREQDFSKEEWTEIEKDLNDFQASGEQMDEVTETNKSREDNYDNWTAEELIDKIRQKDLGYDSLQKITSLLETKIQELRAEIQQFKKFKEVNDNNLNSFELREKERRVSKLETKLTEFRVSNDTTQKPKPNNSNLSVLVISGIILTGLGLFVLLVKKNRLKKI